MVSQVGGDLGLYIGFSMLSVMNFVLLIYGVYQQRDGQNQYPPSDHSVKKAWNLLRNSIEGTVASDQSLKTDQLRSDRKNFNLICILGFKAWRQKLICY